MNSQELLAAGYHKCRDYWEKTPLYFYQKKIYSLSENNTLLYFINVYEYDLTDLPIKKDISYEVKLYLYVDDKADCLHIQFNCDDYTVEELEHYVLTGLYRRLYCVPDKHND